MYASDWHYDHYLGFINLGWRALSGKWHLFLLSLAIRPVKYISIPHTESSIKVEYVPKMKRRVTFS